MENVLLLDVLNRLKTEVGFIQIVSTDDDYLVIQLNEQNQSLLTITIEDPARPMYAVTYQAIGPKAMSIKESETRTSVVLVEGLLWIAKCIKKYGYVIPESTKPRIRKEIKRQQAKKSR